MEIKRIPIVGLIGIAIGIQFALNNNLFIGFVMLAVCWGIAELIGIWIASILPEKYRQSIDYSTWKVYNFIILRLFGFMAILGGLGFLGSLWYLFPNKNYTYTIEEQVSFYIVSIVLFVIGIVLMTKKGYYPKEFNAIREKEEETNK